MDVLLYYIIVMSLNNIREQQPGAQSTTTANHTISQPQIKPTFQSPPKTSSSPSPPESPPPANPTCKICLIQFPPSPSPEPPENLLSPCNCTGSLKYIHQDCLVSWLNTVVQRNLQNGRNTPIVACQICQAQYLYETKNVYVCYGCEDVWENVKENWGVFGLGVFFMVVAVGGLGLVGALVGLGKVSFEDGTEEKGMVIAAIVLLLVLLLAWALRIVYTFFIRKLIFIDRVLQRPQPQVSQLSNFNVSLNMNMNANSNMNLNLNEARQRGRSRNYIEDSNDGINMENHHV